LGAISLGLTINQQINGQDGDNSDNNLTGLISVASAIQILWASIIILIGYLIGAGLCGVSDGLAKTIFRVLTGLIIGGLNIWIFVASIYILANTKYDSNIIINKSIHGIIITTGAFGIISSSLFYIGIILMFLSINKKYKPF
jgi:hypothetical protein